MDAATTGVSQKAGTLPPELGEMVLELALALHKRAIYPSGHPLLNGAVDSLVGRMRRALQGRGTVSIGVARRQLIVEGVATEEAHPLLGEMASHLHEHQIAAVRIMDGVERDEVDDFLTTVATSAGRVDRPLGMLGAEALSRWRHLALYPVSFNRLELVGDGLDGEGESRESTSEAAQLWLGLARSALADVDESRDGSPYAPTEVADAIDRNGSEAYDQVVLGYLLQIATELTTDGRPPSEALRGRVSQLVRSMRPETLSRLMQMGGDSGQRQRFLLNATDSLSALAILDLVSASASASGKIVSGSMTRLLRKLARNADTKRRGGQQSDRLLRSQVKRLVMGWTLDDPNPDGYAELLGDVGRHSGQAEDRHLDECEPDHLIEISLDAEVSGPATELAVGRLVLRDGLAASLDRLTSFPETPTREVVIDSLVNGSMLREQLTVEKPDIRVLEHAVQRLRGRAAEALLTALSVRDESDHPWIAALLERVAADGVPFCTARLPQLPPAAQRTLLGVFDALDAFPEHDDLRELARRPDPALRREAIRLMLKHDALREDALVFGLRDLDARIAGMVLPAAMRGCSPRVAAVLMRRLEDESSLTQELRARAMRALAASGVPDALEWMIAFLVTRHWLFRTVRLRRTSPEVVAAVAGLAAHWRSTPEAAFVLDLALHSRDEDVRRAAQMRQAA